MKTDEMNPRAVIERGAVHLWWMDCAQWDTERTARWLSVDEIDRANRFHHQRDHDQYVVTHGLLRRILSTYLECEPGDVAFGVDNRGKPCLAAGLPVQFNLSASRGVGLVGVTTDQAIGVDVEFIDLSLDWSALARRCFTDAERLNVGGLAPVARDRAFYRLWTAKEACVKCSGNGLAIGPERISVDLLAGLAASDGRSWLVSPLECHAEYAACWAVMEPVRSMTLWTWDAGAGPQLVRYSSPALRPATPSAA